MEQQGARRYRDGDDHLVWLEKGKVYKVTLTPMNTSNLFTTGHRIRLEVAGSNFPRFDRNLNTGGNNYDETTSVVAHTSIHHSEKYPSTMTITAYTTHAHERGSRLRHGRCGAPGRAK